MLELVQRLNGHRDRVWQASWHPTKPILISCSTDKTVRQWVLSETEFELRNVFSEGHDRTIRSIEYHPSGEMFATGSFDSTVCIWLPDGPKWCNEMVLEGHENEVKCVRWSPSGDILATASRDKSVWLWQRDEDNDFDCIAVLQEHTQDIKGIIWQPLSDECFLSFSYDDTIRVWCDDDDMGDWYCKQILDGHTSTVWSAKFSPDGKYFVSVGDDRKLILWRDNGKFRYEIVQQLEDLHEGPIYSVDWNLEDYIITAGGDNAINLFKFENEKLIKVEKIENAHGEYDVNHVLWCTLEGYHNMFASCGDDNQINIYRFK